jgi:hypothetical protein
MSVSLLATSWMSENSGFDSSQIQEIFSLFHTPKPGSGVRPASYVMDTENSFPLGQVAAHFHLVPRSRTVELYLQSLIRVRGLVLSKLKSIDYFTFYS